MKGKKYKQKTKNKYQTMRTVPKSIQKIVETNKVDTSKHTYT